MANWKERLLQALNTASDTQSQTTFTDRAVDAKLEQGDIKGATDMAKAGAVGAASGLMTSLLLPEFSTYGLLGGASRIAGGTAGSAIGSTALGKIGDKIDKKYKTNWAGTTGRIVGGFAGWPTGSNFAYKGALDLASKIPSLAKVGTTNRFIGDVAGRALGKTIKNSNLTVGPLRHALKTNITPNHSTFGISEYELFDTLNGKSIGKLGTTFDIRQNKFGIPHVDNIIGTEGTKGISRSLYNAALIDNPSGLISGESLVRPEITESVWKHFPYKIISNNGIRPNNTQGAIIDLNAAETFVPTLTENKVIHFTPIPKKSVSTVHFDPRIKPLSRPISEFEKNGKYTLDELHQMGFKLPRKHLQGENAVKMFKEYGSVEIPENSQIIEQLRKYVPEARERYGLVGNTSITDDEIAGSLYKKVLELGGDTAAVNEFGEPLVLFRGDTKRYNTLRKVISPEELKSRSGSMDNSFGNLFLGQLDRPGEGVERYIHYVHQYPSGATEVYPSATGERLIWNGNKIREQGAPIFIPEKYLTYDIGKPFKRYGEQIRVRKISSELAKPNSNDINAFVIRTPAVRNSSSEISPEMGGEFINIDGIPKFKNSNYINREHAALRIRQILDDAELKNQGLLKSDAYSPLRENEHFEYDYYALPNFNIRGAKHILPFDLRMPTQWESRIIYRKQGGTLKAQPGMVLPTIPSALTKAYNKLDSALTPISKWESKYNVKANASLGPLELLNPEAWVGIDISTLDKAHKGVELAKEVPKLKDIPSIPLKARMESIFKKVVKQPTTKSEKGLFSYVKNKHPEDIANWEKYMDEYTKYWKK